MKEIIETEDVMQALQKLNNAISLLADTAFKKKLEAESLKEELSKTKTSYDKIKPVITELTLKIDGIINELKEGES